MAREKSLLKRGSAVDREPSDEQMAADPGIGYVTGAHLTIGLALLYLFGFAVCNTHFASYELVRLELLRGRYIAAAGLFSVVVAPTVFFATLIALMSIGFRDFIVQISVARLLLTLVVLWLYLYFGVPFWGSRVIAELGVPGLGHEAAALTEGFLRGTFVFSLAIIGSRVLLWRLAPAYFLPQLVLPIRALAVVVAIVAFTSPVAIVFGQRIYPYISPAYGGGGVWIGHISVDIQGLPSEIGQAVTKPVIILDRDDHYLNFLVCAGTPRPALRPVAIPANNVHAVQLVRVVAIPDIKARMRKLGCLALSS